MQRAFEKHPGDSGVGASTGTPLRPPTTHPDEAEFSSHTSAKTTYPQRLNTEADVRTQLSSGETDVKEIPEVLKQVHSYHFFKNNNFS